MPPPQAIDTSRALDAKATVRDITSTSTNKHITNDAALQARQCLLVKKEPVDWCSESLHRGDQASRPFKKPAPISPERGTA